MGAKKIVMVLLYWLLFASTFAHEWKGEWIVPYANQDLPNRWYAFRKSVELDTPPQRAIARIAVDSKYWLWVNGELVIFEGGLKRGPTPEDTYYDQVDLAPFLKPGHNILALKVWYFGKDGFSHNSSGKAALLFDCQAEGLTILSDTTWKAWCLTAYQTCPPPAPNYRLSESSLLYDARLDDGDWTATECNDSGYGNAVALGKAGASPWNRLHPHGIPPLKNFGLKAYAQVEKRGDTLKCKLPYNCQFTPFLKLKAPAGKLVDIFTDNYLTYHGGDVGIRAAYITREGEQHYESLGWINGHYLYYVVPEEVEVIEVAYRETGYNTEFEGEFSCSNHFFNQLWTKARRTLYITMRDNFMDCPDRERAQWTGDAVNEALACYYLLSTASHQLVRKWLYEIIGWQPPCGKLFAPAPSGVWRNELPGQILSTVGKYGYWSYYLYTGDREALEILYPAIKRYLALWEEDGTGVMKMRQGDWTWGDWGDNRDMVLIYNLLYALAIEGMQLAADELGYQEDAAHYAAFRRRFKESFNRQFWNGTAYRHPAYTGLTDDRIHALAVVAGVADPSQYQAIAKVFEEQRHASPYMEMYVYEAMMLMGMEDAAFARHEARFSNMVNHPDFTTLFEGWGIGSDGFGGGTVNHAWSGGGVVVNGRYLNGIRPIKAGFEEFIVAPQPGSMASASCYIPTVRGAIVSAFTQTNAQLKLTLTVPQGSLAQVTLPKRCYKSIKVNGKRRIMADKKELSDTPILCQPGKYTIIGAYGSSMISLE